VILLYVASVCCHFVFFFFISVSCMKFVLDLMLIELFCLVSG
jgi:hypothetical protein